LPRPPVPPRKTRSKFSRPLGEIARAFRPQVAVDDCLVACLGGILAEFGERRGLAIDLRREVIKQVCGYRGAFGSTSTKIVPNLNVHFRNARIGQDIEAKEKQGDTSSRIFLDNVCMDDRTSFPIVGVGPKYWSTQTHLAVRNQAEMDHALIVLRATDELVQYFDPFQRPGPVGESPEVIREIPAVHFLKLWQEAFMGPLWVLWIAQVRERPSLESFGGRKADV